MGLDEEIRSRFLSDTETILEAHMDDLEGMFEFHEDGTTELLGRYRKMSPESQILLHFIAERYKFEAGISESDALYAKDLYHLFPDKSDSTVRGYMLTLRKEGYTRPGDDGNELVVERLPEAIERIEDEVSKE